MNNDAKTFSYLAYVGPLFLVGLFSDIRRDPTLRFHLNQGCVLFLCELAGMILPSWAALFCSISFRRCSLCLSALLRLRSP